MQLISYCIDFEWALATRGYIIVEDIVIPKKGPLRATKPLQQYPGLFKQFAKLEPTAASVARFANRFGLLQNDPKQNSLADWFIRSREFAEFATCRNASWSHGQKSSLNTINEIIRTEVITEIARVGLVLRPRSLLAAMALQLGFWLQDSDDRIGQCAECGNTWVIGPRTGHRVSRKYCSPNCSDASRYRRKKQKIAKAT
jgi:hypothetical protein